MQKLKKNEARPKFTGSYKKSVNLLKSQNAWNSTYFSLFQSQVLVFILIPYKAQYIQNPAHSIMAG